MTGWNDLSQISVKSVFSFQENTFFDMEVSGKFDGHEEDEEACHCIWPCAYFHATQVPTLRYPTKPNLVTKKLLLDLQGEVLLQLLLQLLGQLLWKLALQLL